MKRMLRAVAATLLLSACASDPHEEMRAEAENVDKLAHQIAREATAYCDGQLWAQPSCVQATAEYRAAVVTALEEAAERAVRMDGYLREVGEESAADTACGSAALTAEVEQFAARPCSPIPDGVGALEHCAVMTSGAAQMHARANAVLAATRHLRRIGGSGSMPGVLRPMPTGEHAWPWAGNDEPTLSAMCRE